MDWRIEVIVVPVSDVDRAKEFYVDGLGFRLDTDHVGGEHFRVVQVTPPGSGCSLAFGRGLGGGEPGTLKGTQFVVPDARAAVARLDEAGISHSGLKHFVAGTMTDGPEPDDADFGTFVFFDDPDGNSFAIQQGRRPAA
ncbi:VOC family protein [Nocardioides sp. MJB4]|uniref:VOC family protein n=2 Tax=Nocardioides donggukensis TaxID=2774019 RepID=A0A927Q2B6_9ACTN|nr:VOC family protein [Nocardioides donggukensis]